MRPYLSHKAFTLAELLICLAILGEIATFTIPKVLSGQQNRQYNAQAKEAIAMISAAYQKAKMDGIATSTMTPSALKPYMNYVSNYTGLIDRYPTDTSMDCNGGGYSCVKLHSGGVLLFDFDNFGGTGTTNSILFGYDPDGTYSGLTSGNSKSLMIFVYYNGRVSTYANIAPGTVTAGAWPGSACASCEPSWFSF
jgi:prepilin-type N-terminal cleavage/methylation domain-containing protein